MRVPLQTTISLHLGNDVKSPIHSDHCAEIYWNGGRHSGPNRWFDKSIQIMVQKNGKAGYMGEHSMMDGMPAVGLCSHIVSTKYESLISKEKSSTRAINHSDDETSLMVEPLFDTAWSKLDKSAIVRDVVTRGELFNFIFGIIVPSIKFVIYIS